MKQLLVSVIVPTRNSAKTLSACLGSIDQQTYSPIELIVVDNHSTDNTVQIAHSFTKQVYTKGPERSAQRNFGVSKARGDFVLIIDSDMVLTSKVISACVEKVQQQADVKGVIIPEESFGQGFWAKCKQLERSFYVGIDWMEAARFFDKTIFLKLGGYDSQLVSGEDWDLSRRVAAMAPIARINQFIMHDEGRLRLAKTLQKKYYYAQKAGTFLQKNPVESTLTAQEGPLKRYGLFLSRPRQLFRKPLIGIGMLFMKTCEFGVGGIGYMASRMQKEQQ